MKYYVYQFGKEKKKGLIKLDSQCSTGFLKGTGNPHSRSYSCPLTEKPLLSKLFTVSFSIFMETRHQNAHQIMGWASMSAKKKNPPQSYVYILKSSKIISRKRFCPFICFTMLFFSMFRILLKLTHAHCAIHSISSICSSSIVKIKHIYSTSIIKGVVQF